MKTAIDREVLYKALNHVQSVVERRTTIPVLSNLLVETLSDGMRLTATDLDMEVVETVDTMVFSNGVTTIPAHTLFDVVRKLPEGAQVELDFDAAKMQMQLSSGRSRFSLPCLSADDFPSLAQSDFDHHFEMPAKDIVRMIDGTKFAISTEETRYYLNGIHLHAHEEDGKSLLRAVATDGHRLARVQLPLPEGASAIPPVIVPRKTITELRRLLENEDEKIQLAVSENKIQFRVGSTILTSKLIDGNFPDYERVIPVGNDKMLKLDRPTFASAVDRVSTISTEKSRAVKMILSGSTLTLSVNNPESGSATDELPVVYEADDLEIGFNARYVLDVMSQIAGETARFELSDQSSPTIILDDEDESQSALYVLMPMRV